MSGKVLALVLVALCLFGLAFAERPVPRVPGPPVDGSEEDNGAPAVTQALRGFRERFAHRVKGDTNIEEVVQKALRRRREAVRVRVGREQIERWKAFSRRYINFVQKIRETAERYRLKLREWRRAKELFEEGNISEEEYLAKAKDVVLTAIDATIERLQALKENNIVPEDANGIDEAIMRLEDLRAKIEAAEDLDTLKELYREEVLPALREHHNRTFLCFYLRGAIRATQSIVVRLDVAAMRLARYVDRAKELGIYDEEMDARVTAIFAESEAVRAKLNALEEEVAQKEITPREYFAKLIELKREVRRIYREIADLIRECARRYALQVRERVRVRAEVNASEEIETEVEGNVEVNA